MRVLLLCGSSMTSKIMLHYLASQSNYVLKAIIEERTSARKMLHYRIKKLGWVTCFGQLMFQIGVAPILNFFSKQRKLELLGHYQNKLQENPDGLDWCKVESVNGPKTISLIENFRPDLIVVNGTRIIKSNVLDLIKVPMINIHLGITPMYRGVHGGYWALYEKDRENFGSTVHLVNAGVDTGPILAQVRMQPQPNDNFCTYPLLQFMSSLSALKSVLNGFESGENLQSQATTSESSKQWYHPTIWQYLWARIHGVR